MHHSRTLISEDPYEILQVSPRASSDVIRAAYRVLARSYHPDVSACPAAALRMQQLNAAYKALIDPALRAEFDAQLPIERARVAATQRLSPPRRSERARVAAPPPPGVRRARPLMLALMLGAVLFLLIAVVFAVSFAIDALDAPVSAEHFGQAAAALGIV